MLGEELLDDVNRGRLRGRQEHPDKTGGFVNNQKVRSETVVGGYNSIL